MHMEASLGRAVLLAAFPPPTLGEFPPKRLLTPGHSSGGISQGGTAP